LAAQNGGSVAEGKANRLRQAQATRSQGRGKKGNDRWACIQKTPLLGNAGPKDIPRWCKEMWDEKDNEQVAALSRKTCFPPRMGKNDH